MNTIPNPKCTGCKCYIVTPELNPRSNIAYKSCLTCRDRSVNRKKCPHDKYISFCRECNGSAFCKHDKMKHRCRECGGSDFCKEHDRIKTQCRECNGSSFCPHEKIKSRCRECNSSAICKHDKKNQPIMSVVMYSKHN